MTEELSTDEELQELIEESLKEAGLNVDVLEIRVKRGFVYITGQVGNWQEKQMLENLIERIPDIMKARVELEVVAEGEIYDPELEAVETEEPVINRREATLWTFERSRTRDVFEAGLEGESYIPSEEPVEAEEHWHYKHEKEKPIVKKVRKFK
jgi:hypothetical protein